jgi:CheY-like chemotaxis protein
MTDTTPAPQRTVLVVEDDALLLVTLKQQFEEAGYLVETARNGAEGRERFAAAHPDVVVSDVMMPEEDGIKMLEGIRAAHPEDRTPFIFLSNADDMDYVASAMANQAVAYLLKSDRQVDSIVNLVEEKLRKA